MRLAWAASPPASGIHPPSARIPQTSWAPQRCSPVAEAPTFPSSCPDAPDFSPRLGRCEARTLGSTGIPSSPAATPLCSPATAAAGTRPAPARREPRPRIPLSSQNLIPPLDSPRGAKSLTQVHHHTPSPNLATPTDDAPLLICHHAHPSSPRQPLGLTRTRPTVTARHALALATPAPSSSYGFFGIRLLRPVDAG